MSDVFSPFSASALASLPVLNRPQRYTRADAIPETEGDVDGQRPTIRDYHAINSLPPQVRVPKKIATPIKVEGKVWFANERSEWFTPGFRTENVSDCPDRETYSMDIVVELGCSSWSAVIGTFQRLEGLCCT